VQSCRAKRTGTLAIILLALQPLMGLAFGDTAAIQPPSCSFIRIDIPNSSGELGFTHLADMNNDGEITGGFTNSSSFSFLLGKAFRSTDIQCPGTVNAAPNAQPQSINKHGEITGFCLTDKPPGFLFHNKHHDRQYTFLDFPGATLTAATGINDAGQVVGDYRDSSGKLHGFYWDDGRFLTFDVPFPEATATAPTGINNVGQIVGFYFDNDVTEAFLNGHAHGFLYDHGFFTSVDFPDATATLPVDSNDRGQIMGIYTDNDMVAHSFLRENSRFTAINVPFPDVILTDVSGINNRGQLVGRYVESNPGDPVNPLLSHGFIATPDSKPELLGSDPHASANL
jgi:probable HAF family extracellular repeat protein